MLSSGYLAIKTLHVIAVISWMAGILYLYRLFVYHFDYNSQGKEVRSLLSLMEVRLFRFITLPSMTVAVVTGAALIAIQPLFLKQLWLHIKLASVLALIGVTLCGQSFIQRFQAQDLAHFSSKKLRILNEIPTLLMIIIVSMVIFKPISF